MKKYVYVCVCTCVCVFRVGVEAVTWVHAKGEMGRAEGKTIRSLRKRKLLKLVKVTWSKRAFITFAIKPSTLFFSTSPRSMWDVLIGWPRSSTAGLYLRSMATGFLWYSSLSRFSGEYTWMIQSVTRSSAIHVLSLNLEKTVFITYTYSTSSCIIVPLPLVFSSNKSLQLW